MSLERLGHDLAAVQPINVDFYGLLLAEANKYFKLRNLDPAEMLLKKFDGDCRPALRREALLLLSRVYRQRSQYGLMSEPLLRASAEFPGDISVLTALAEWHDLIRDTATAVKLWREVHLAEKKAHPKESTYLGYGRALRNNGEVDSAHRILAEALKHFPRSSDLYLELAALGSSANCMADILRHSRSALLLSIAGKAAGKQYATISQVIQLLSSSYRAIDESKRLPNESAEPDQTATVCLIVKDESKYILEWIAYYQELGFDEIFVYDNETSDGSEKLLRELADAGIIELIDWPNMPRQPAQFAAYEDALTRCRTEWIAFLDIDEFLLLKAHGNIKEFLSGFSSTVGGVAINWKIFGSGGAREAGPGLVIERFTRCGHPEHLGWQVKSVVRRRGAQFASNHVCRLRMGFSYVDASGRDYTGDRRICYDVAQVNHYVSKSWSEFLEKARRGRVNLAPEANYFGEDPTGIFEAYDQNDCVDEDILRYRSAVTERIDAIKETLARSRAR